MGLTGRRLASFALAFCACAFLRTTVLDACTAFCATGGGLVLVGNNEDWSNPRTKLWFVLSRFRSSGDVPP